MPIVFLSLGSNLSPRSRHISRSVEMLRLKYPRNFKISPVYETNPYQDTGGNLYLNCCLCFFTDDLPETVLKQANEIENQMGRVRNGEKWQDRIIDIDLILYGELTICSKGLTVPHYDLSQRDFFLIPLLDLDRNLMNPQSGKLLLEELQLIPETIRTNPVEYNKNIRF